LPPIRGAMENISLVTWIDIFVQDEVNALEFKMITDEVNIHEMGKVEPDKKKIQFGTNFLFCNSPYLFW
jgi:hypothetical protein